MEILSIPEFIIQSEVDAISGSVRATVLSASDQRVWTGSATHRNILEASSSVGYAEQYEDFMQLIRNTLAGSVDAKGRQTECSVNTEEKRLFLKVFPTGAQDIEFEILSIPLKSHAQSYAQVSTTLMKYLIEDRITMKTKITAAATTKSIMTRDLNQLKQAFDEWSSEKQEQYEVDLYKRFKDILNMKKRKIRELMASLEVAESNLSLLKDRKPILVEDSTENDFKRMASSPSNDGTPTQKNASKRMRMESPLENLSQSDDDGPPPILLGGGGSSGGSVPMDQERVPGADDQTLGTTGKQPWSARPFDLSSMANIGIYRFWSRLTSKAPLPTSTPAVALIQGQSFPLDVPIVDDHLPFSSTVPSLIEIGSKSRYVDAAPQDAKCSVIQIQMVARHGTRNPTAGNLKTMTAPAQAGLLSGQGRQDHVQLGQRVASRYATLISDPSRIDWQATNVSRALSSGQSFISGLLTGDAGFMAVRSMFNVVPRPLDSDLRPFDSCSTYLKDSAVQKNQTNQADDTFIATKYPAIAKRIAKMIGVDSLAATQVKTMFDLCSFGNTLQGVQNRFCSVFTEADFQLADFSSDLSFNTDIAAMISNPDTAPKATFKFAHAETIAPLIVGLRLFRNGAPLSPNMTVDGIQSRTFRSARFSPFSANVMFELLDCGSSEKAVRVLVGEVAQLLPGCPDVVCPLSAFRKVLSGKLNCDYDGAVCNNSIPTVGGAARFPNTATIPIGNIIAALNADADNN
ncbi:histidine phosphatase superfamily [Chytriomyces cf. hyalinus JEL632]|nr:histidine phosphatase superfamily [Chytriomyces cf. hyalinus JEL632]